MLTKPVILSSSTLVPGTGIEPAHHVVYAPKAYASTSSAIRAYKKNLDKL